MKRESRPQKSWIDGCFVSKVSKAEICSLIKEWILEKEKGNYITAINVGKLVMMQKDEKLAGCILKSSINIADGFPIFLATKILGNPIPKRIPGIELMEQLLKLASEHRFSVYFFGSKPEILEKAIHQCLLKYPSFKIAGSHHGYYQKGEEDSLVKEIASHSPDILLVGLGLPQKEYFIDDYVEKLNASVVLAVGGAFDVLAGIKKRAPRWVQSIGIEWLWRSVYDRSRGKLIFKTFVPFIRILLEELFNQRIARMKRIW